jgi:competence ComEA-like helix-hairpin-helix protein
MTGNPAKIAAIGLIAFLLALISLGTTESALWNDRLTEAKRSAPVDERKKGASIRALRALRLGQGIDINRASAADLELLPGIGPKLAERIVADRSQNGSFRNVKDLIRVNGIGPATLSRIERLVTTGNPSTRGTE